MHTICQMLLGCLTLAIIGNHVHDYTVNYTGSWNFRITPSASISVVSTEAVCKRHVPPDNSLHLDALLCCGLLA